MKNQENLEGIVAKLKEQGIEAGEKEKKKLIEAATKEAEKIVAKAEEKSKKMVEKAQADAAQLEKNSQAAIAQAARDVVEATKIALTNHLKEVFGKQCEALITQEEYLKELLPAVLKQIEGTKTAEVPPAQAKKMQKFIAGSALKEGVEIKPLAKSEAKIAVTCSDNKEIQMVITSKDIEDALFSLLNHDLLERINKSREE